MSLNKVFLSWKTEDHAIVVNSMLKCGLINALKYDNLLEAVSKIPLTTNIKFWPVDSTWIFSSHHDVRAYSLKERDYICDRDEFIFKNRSLDLAIGAGLYYYYHMRLR